MRLGRASPRPAAALDSTAFPHILDRLVALADTEALVALRALSRRMRDAADAILFTHIVLDISPEGGAILCDPETGHRLPYLPWDWYVDDAPPPPSLPRLSAAVAGDSGAESSSGAEDAGNTGATGEKGADGKPKPPGSLRDASRARQLAHVRSVDYFNGYQPIRPFDVGWAKTLPRLPKPKLQTARHRLELSSSLERFDTIARGGIQLETATYVDCVDLSPAHWAYVHHARLNVPAFVRRHVLHLTWPTGAPRLKVVWGHDLEEVVFVFGTAPDHPRPPAAPADASVGPPLVYGDSVPELAPLGLVIGAVYDLLRRGVRVSFVGAETLGEAAAVALRGRVEQAVLGHALRVSMQPRLGPASALIQATATAPANADAAPAAPSPAMPELLDRLRFLPLEQWRAAAAPLETQWPTYTPDRRPLARPDTPAAPDASAAAGRARWFLVGALAMLLVSHVLRRFSLDGTLSFTELVTR